MEQVADGNREELGDLCGRVLFLAHEHARNLRLKGFRIPSVSSSTVPLSESGSEMKALKGSGDRDLSKTRHNKKRWHKNNVCIQATTTQCI